jgi:hypothetical protein
VLNTKTWFSLLLWTITEYESIISAANFVHLLKSKPCKAPRVRLKSLKQVRCFGCLLEKFWGTWIGRETIWLGLAALDFNYSPSTSISNIA